jgi:hypothetical protein
VIVGTIVADAAYVTMEAKKPRPAKFEALQGAAATTQIDRFLARHPAIAARHARHEDHRSRTHLALGKDAPDGRVACSRAGQLNVGTEGLEHR